METDIADPIEVEVTEIHDAEQLPVVTGEDIALIGVGGASVCLVVLVGGVVAGNAMLISVLSMGGGTILWIKMPETLEKAPPLRWIVNRLPISAERKAAILSFKWKPALLKHELLTDIAVSLGAIAFFGLTLSGIVAAGFVGVSMSVLLRLRRVVLCLKDRMEAATIGGNSWCH